MNNFPSKPIVSLIIGVHNGAKDLVQTIESVLAQTFVNFECIIVNDGSTDGTAKILEDFMVRDSRIKVLTNDLNIGLTKSLNRGIEAAKGEYIARLDCGDISEPNRFELQVTYLNMHSECVLVGSWAYVIDEHSKRIGSMKNEIDHVPLKKVLIRHNPFVHSSVMMRKSILDAVGPYNPVWKYAQDYELFFRIASRGGVANIPQYLVSYRIAEKSITRRKNKKQTLFAIKARVAAIKRGEYPLFSYIHLLKPLIGYFLPYSWKDAVKRVLGY